MQSHIKIVSALFALIFALASQTFAQEEDESPDDVLQGFNDVRLQLKAGMENKLFCVPFSEYSAETKSCRYSDLCKFLAKNVDRPYLYVNASGAKVPNFKLQEVEKSIEACFMKTAQPLIQDKLKEAATDAFKKSQLKRVTAEQAFLSSVTENHEEEAWLKIQKAALDKSLVDLNTPDNAVNKLLAKAARDPKEELNALEETAGVKFSDQTRKLWIDYSIAVTQPITAVPPQLPAWEDLMQDPFIDPVKLYNPQAAGNDDQLKKNQALAQKESERAYKLFQETQAGIIALLKRKRSKGNEDEIDSMIQRVSNIAFDPVLSAENGCQRPNAFFSPNTHKFRLCPQIMEMPNAALKSVIGHEIAHSIDPCNLGLPLLKVSGTLKTAQVTSTTNGRQNSFNPQLAIDEREGLFSKGKADAMKKWAAKKYDPFEITEIAAAVPLAKYPFSKTLNCLASKKSVHAKITSQKELELTLKQGIQKLTDAGYGADQEKDNYSADLERMLRAKENLSQFYQESGACSNIVSGERSQISEAFADWIGIETLGSGTLTRDEAFEATAMHLRAGCPGMVSKKTLDLRDALFKRYKCEGKPDDESISGGIKTAQSLDRGEHPWTPDRFNQLMLAKPEYAKALGCKKPKGVKHCE